MLKILTKKQKKSEAGFTLVEVMVTLAIIGLMVMAVVISVRPAQDKGLTVRTLSDINTLAQAVEMYRLDTHQYPESLEALLGQEGGDRVNPAGYIRNLPTDPWGNDYGYAYPGNNSVYDIWSYGADGEEGGEGINADITNWSR